MGEVDNGLSKLPEMRMEMWVFQNKLWNSNENYGHQQEVLQFTYLTRDSSFPTGFFIVKFVFSWVPKACAFFEIDGIIDDLDVWAAYYIQR